MELLVLGDFWWLMVEVAGFWWLFVVLGVSLWLFWSSWFFLVHFGSFLIFTNFYST